MPTSPLPRIVLLSSGLVCAAALVVYAGLGWSLARPETAALAGLPSATQAQAGDLYFSVRLAPWNSSNYIRLGMFFLANNRPAPAVEWFRRATVWDAHSWRAWYYLALAQRASHRYAEADAAFHKVLSIEPDYIEARYQLATLMLDRGQFDDSAAAYNSLLGTAAEQTRVLQGLGLALLGLRNYPGAARAFTQALERFPTYGDAHAGLAASLRATGDDRRAAHEIRLARNWRGIAPRTGDPSIEEMESDFPTSLSLVQAAYRTSDPRIAVESMEKALALDPGMTLAWENIISLYGQAHRPKDAERAWNRLAALDPNNVRGRFDLAVALAPQAASRPVAVALLKQVLVLDPSYADVHRVLGVVAELDGNGEEAIRQFRTALESDPSLSEPHVDLGLILLRSGKAKEAQAELLRALLPPCENPERTLIRELTALKDPAVERAYEQAVRAQAEEQKQYGLITILNRLSH